MADSTSQLYAPKPLKGELPPRAVELVERGVGGRLALYTGAGLSMSAPTSLPSGAEVQRRAADRARDLLEVEVAEPAGEIVTLEELGAAAEARSKEHLERLRGILAKCVHFINARPNFAHYAVAILLREGLAGVMSVNWDRATERAAADLDVLLEPNLDATARNDDASQPRLDKLNGCASKAATLRVTRAEIDEPQAWVAHRVGFILSDAVVVFVGLGTVGNYVADGVGRVLREQDQRSAPIVIVAPTLSQEWAEILGDAAEQAHVSALAEEFLDDLLRAAVREGFALAQATVDTLGSHAAASGFASGLRALTEALKEHDAMSVWRWWRDGVQGYHGQIFILSDRGAGALAVAGYLAASSSAVSVTEGESAVEVELDAYYLEVCAWPGEDSRLLVAAQADRLRKRRRGGHYRDSAKPVVSVCSSHNGALPGDGVTYDIVAPESSATDILEGSETIDMRWVAAERCLQGASPVIT